jgi:hypothetical protein
MIFEILHQLIQLLDQGRQRHVVVQHALPKKGRLLYTQYFCGI